jgi:hypothetical protein
MTGDDYQNPGTIKRSQQQRTANPSKSTGNIKTTLGYNEGNAQFKFLYLHKSRLQSTNDEASCKLGKAETYHIEQDSVC